MCWALLANVKLEEAGHSSLAFLIIHTLLKGQEYGSLFSHKITFTLQELKNVLQTYKTVVRYLEHNF